MPSKQTMHKKLGLRGLILQFQFLKHKFSETQSGSKRQQQSRVNESSLWPQSSMWPPSSEHSQWKYLDWCVWDWSCNFIDYLLLIAFICSSSSVHFQPYRTIPSRAAPASNNIGSAWRVLLWIPGPTDPQMILLDKNCLHASCHFTISTMKNRTFFFFGDGRDPLTVWISIIKIECIWSSRDPLST